MNKLIKRFFYIASILAVTFTAGCTDDLPEEITQLQVDRLFSPTDIEAMIVNQTSVRLKWNAVKHADSYIIEIFENGDLNFDGTPVVTKSDVTFSQLPITISGFGGETSYSARVKAVGDDITESKWSTVTFRTNAEQILFDIDPTEIQATSVTLRWPAGEFATHILVTPGDISHTVTTDEIAAGVAVVTGLTGDTDYTAKLMNGTKTRGTKTFKTLIDIGDATAVYPEDDLNAVIASATDGEVLVLFPGVYEAYIGDIAINKSITIKGFLPHNKPVIYNRFVFSAGATEVNFLDLEMVGTHADLAAKITQAFFFDAGTYNVTTLKIEGCTIRDYNQELVYGGSAVLKIDDLIINNCVMSNIVNDGGDFIDFRSGHVANLTITNSTFNKVAATPRDFVRLDNSSGNFPGSTSKVLIDKCTFYQVSNGRRILYVRFLANENTVTNTIFAGADATYGGYYSNQANTAQPVCSKNNYFNAPGFIGGITNGKFDISGNHTTFDPGFTNAEGGNFTVSHQELILQGIGDPRWLP